MKKSFLIAIILIGTFDLFGDSSTNIAGYDRYFNEINEVRVGISDEDVDKLSNPFAVIQTAAIPTSNNTSEPTFQLNAIVENKVKVNNSWLKQGSSINGLRVIAIKQKSVVLGNDNKRLELFLREKNENSIITAN
ncbi:MAG: hypothetical protein LBS26_00305 [Campylobacteraceae bacterium]|nr:hypothetical protein [Campylobacteraceae bacterium]